MMGFEYERITDWSIEARATVARTRGDEIRLLLDEAWTIFYERPGQSLTALGFEDVATAVEWCIERFATGAIEPSRLHPASRSFRLFTEVDFWVAQRVSARAVHTARRLTVEFKEEEHGATTLNELGETDATPQLRRAATTLQELRRRTCASLVRIWLDQWSAPFRALLGGVPPPAVEAEGAERKVVDSPKRRSFDAADALFRFAVLFLRFALERSEDRAVRVCAASLFTACADVSPFRREDVAVAKELGLAGSREVGRMRRRGVASLLRQCLDFLSVRTNTAAMSAELRLCEYITRQSLRHSLLHLYKIADDAELVRLLEGASFKTPETR